MGGKGGKCGCCEPHQAKDFCPKKIGNGCALGLVQPLIPGAAILDFLSANRTKSGFWGPWSWVLPALKRKKLGRNPRMKISQVGSQLHVGNVPRSPTFNPQCKVTLPLRAGNPNFPPRGMGFAVLDFSVASRTCLEAHTHN